MSGRLASEKIRKKKKYKEVTFYQGGLASAWNAFLLNVFNSMGYLRWRAGLFHAKEPEKEKLVLKISVLVLGKSCLFPWTWRCSEGIMRSFRYCGAVPWTTFCFPNCRWRNTSHTFPHHNTTMTIFSHPLIITQSYPSHANIIPFTRTALHGGHWSNDSQKIHHDISKQWRTIIW